MSFYTNKKPRLIEPHIVNKLIMLKEPIPKKSTINYNKIGDYLYNFFERNWSFITIIIILFAILYYRYRINKKETIMKRARKVYMDKLIMDNYMKELQKIESTNNYNENDLIIDETIAENNIMQNPTNIMQSQQNNILNNPYDLMNNMKSSTNMMQSQPNIMQNQSNNIFNNPYDLMNNKKNIDEDSDNELSFNQLFSSNLDYYLPGFDSNSSFSNF